MKKLTMTDAVRLLAEKYRDLPQTVQEGDNHWFTKLYVADLLQKEAHYEEAHHLLREVYVENSFQYDKDIHAGYEDYIQEKVQFFVNLAALNMRITQKAKCSVPYLDEALIILDSAESVSPYISYREIEALKEDYIRQIP
jgi:hypothetical protein